MRMSLMSSAWFTKDDLIFLRELLKVIKLKREEENLRLFLLLMYRQLQDHKYIHIPKLQQLGRLLLRTFFD